MEDVVLGRVSICSLLSSLINIVTTAATTTAAVALPCRVVYLHCSASARQSRWPLDRVSLPEHNLKLVGVQFQSPNFS